MKFLLTILIIFLMGFIFSRTLPWLLRLWFKRIQKRYGMDPNAHTGRPPRPPGSVEVNTGGQKKRIDKSAGEYVEFEEINEA